MLHGLAVQRELSSFGGLLESAQRRPRSLVLSRLFMHIDAEVPEARGLDESVHYLVECVLRKVFQSVYFCCLHFFTSFRFVFCNI